MSIQEKTGKFKDLLSDSDVFLGILIIAVGVASFGLGRLSVSEKTLNISSKVEFREAPILETRNNEIPLANSQTALVIQENYVASKNGSKYHLPWCGGVKQMKEENKIWFETKEDAELAGYTPAANCKGI